MDTSVKPSALRELLAAASAKEPSVNWRTGDGSQAYNAWLQAKSDLAAQAPALAQEVLDQRGPGQALEEALILEWFHNHSEHCRIDWPHDGNCYWPRPALLEGAPDGPTP